MAARTNLKQIFHAGALIAVTVAFAGCFGGDDDNAGPAGAKGRTASGQGPKGGILRLGSSQDPGIDPQKTNYQLELFWCCLTRTLLTYNLKPVDQGGRPIGQSTC